MPDPRATHPDALLAHLPPSLRTLLEDALWRAGDLGAPVSALGAHVDGPALVKLTGWPLRAVAVAVGGGDGGGLDMTLLDRATGERRSLRWERRVAYCDTGWLAGDGIGEALPTGLALVRGLDSLLAALHPGVVQRQDRAALVGAPRRSYARALAGQHSPRLSTLGRWVANYNGARRAGDLTLRIVGTLVTLGPPATPVDA